MFVSGRACAVDEKKERGSRKCTQVWGNQKEKTLAGEVDYT